MMNLKVASLSLLIAASCVSAHAQSAGVVLGTGAAAGAVAGIVELVPFSAKAVAAPEINGADMGGLILLLGGIAVLRGRNNRSLAVGEAK